MRTRRRLLLSDERKNHSIQKTDHHYHFGYCSPTHFRLRSEVFHHKYDLVTGLIMKKKILVLCTGNSCRSQIAEGYLRHFAGPKADIYSAGVETHGVNPKAIATMREDGIDISNHTSNHVDEYASIDFDFVITVCDNAKERCPYFPTKAAKFHHNFPDPAKAQGTEEEIMDEFRRVRQMIKEYSEKFVEEQL